MANATASQATTGTVSNFLGSPEGMITLMGVGVMLGLFYAYRKNSGNDNVAQADKADSIFSDYFEAIKRHGKTTNRYLVQDGTVLGVVWREDNAHKRKWSDEVKDMLNIGDDDGDDGRERQDMLKLLVHKNKLAHKILKAVPLLRKLVLEVYLLSKANIDRAISAVVVSSSVTFDKFCGIWIDMSPESISDVFNLHGLDMLRQNMEKNEEFAERMIALDPETARGRAMIQEEYSRRSDMFNSKKRSNHE